MHFSIDNFNEDFNMLTIISRSNILEFNFVHPKVIKPCVLNELEEYEFLPSVRLKVYA